MGAGTESGAGARPAAASGGSLPLVTGALVEPDEKEKQWGTNVSRNYN